MYISTPSTLNIWSRILPRLQFDSQTQKRKEGKVQREHWFIISFCILCVISSWLGRRQYAFLVERLKGCGLPGGDDYVCVPPGTSFR